MRFPALLTALCLAAAAFAQPPSVKDLPPDGPKPDAVVKAEADQATLLLNQHKDTEALPLAEDLVQQRPRNGYYHEALGWALTNTSGMASTPQQRLDTTLRARHEFQLARALGDDSGNVRIMLEVSEGRNYTLADFQPAPAGDSAEALFAQGEEQFGKHNFKQAAALYQQSANKDPKLYKSALYAGDALFNDGQYDEAGKWFARAISVDPNVETAYRYWGDALIKQGKNKEALDKFLDGIIADPYNQRSWVGLQRWAQTSHAQLHVPNVKLPAGPSEGKPDANGKTSINITMPATADKDDKSSAAWLIYQMTRASWRDEKLRPKDAPAMKTYRHSLAEEAAAIRAMLTVVKEQKLADDKLNPTIRTLRDLDSDGFLEAWILYQGADQGIAQDYVLYRAQHNAQLRGYLLRYIVGAA